MESSETRTVQFAPAHRGQFVVLTMFVVATAAATFAWWWNYHRGDQALEFFGAEGARLIRTAPNVEYLRSPSDESIDISSAPGLLNARTSLLSDASYDWSAPDPRLESPQFSVRFSRGRSHVVVTFDFENRTVRSSTTGRTAKLIQKTAEGWQAYLARQIEQVVPVTPPEPARTDPSE
jgi:hypothetical protein